MSASQVGPIPLGRIAHVTEGQLAAAAAGVLVRGVRQDSRRIEPGDLFVARAGDRVDGLHFAEQAMARGACALMVEQGRQPESCAVPVLVVADVRLAMAQAAQLVYGDPSAAVQVIGITGTNGKTTTAALLHAALVAAGCHPGVMGTFGAHLGELPFETRHNTPEADELTRIVASMAARGATHLVMEVTSHALAQKRVDGIRFRAAALTNVTRDHLDLHGSFAAYAAAKRRLFLDLAPQTAAVMVDDPSGAELAGQVGSDTIRVSLDPHSLADVRPTGPYRYDERGLACEFSTPAGLARLDSPLLGRHNLENLSLALALCIGLGLELEASTAALNACPAVPGRLERCDPPGGDIAVFVDYAHTPDALEKVLSAVRPLTAGRVVCVFGCGGDRDRTKRPLMGEIAGRLADEVVVTSDNPRSEPPERIAAAVVAGLTDGPHRWQVELDRAQAIAQAIAQALPGDLVLIAGKGHETRQVVGEQATDFDDRVHARAALAARRYSLL